MCGIAGVTSLSSERIQGLGPALQTMNFLQEHRGPDGFGTWEHARGLAGFAHRRLSIIDLTDAAHQPMTDGTGNWITYNGEIYNYLELRQELAKSAVQFRTQSDTEVILKAYQKWGEDCVNHLRGMFAFAIWDEHKNSLFCARDRFGIKPFYFTVTGQTFYFASEIKALLPFVPEIETDLAGFKDYLAFQFCLGGKTLFKGINELLPGHSLTIKNGHVNLKRYWQVYYNIDLNHTSRYFEERVLELLKDSINVHLRADVPIGAYVSGGLDSSLVAALASDKSSDFVGFTGKFTYGKEYDESQFAEDLARQKNFELFQLDMTARDFVNNIRKVIFHLDQPVAGPGSFPQYMVSQLAAKHRKVVLGGQGGDEIFGGYTRYLIAYFEQCIKAAIDGTSQSGNFVVTYESIIPNLTALQKYKPMLAEFWKDGLFEELDKRYFRLINRAPSLGEEINWKLLGDYSPYETFREIFKAKNVAKESYFDSMTHFDFKTLLPALLHVEDRVSMAHGLESRVPLLDHALIEFAATIPADVKFKDGNMKHLLRKTAAPYLPSSIMERKDKMGFPVPLVDWIKGDAKDFTLEIFSSRAAQSRTLINNKAVLRNLEKEPKFGRKAWALLSLELWQEEFHDKSSYYRSLRRANINQTKRPVVAST